MSSKRKADVHPAVARLATLAETAGAAGSRHGATRAGQGHPVALVARGQAWRSQRRAPWRALFAGDPGQGAAVSCYAKYS